MIVTADYGIRGWCHHRGAHPLQITGRDPNGKLLDGDLAEMLCEEHILDHEEEHGYLYPPENGHWDRGVTARYRLALAAIFKVRARGGGNPICGDPVTAVASRIADEIADHRRERERHFRSQLTVRRLT